MIRIYNSNKCAIINYIIFNWIIKKYVIYYDSIPVVLENLYTDDVSRCHKIYLKEISKWDGIIEVRFIAQFVGRGFRRRGGGSSFPALGLFTGWQDFPTGEIDVVLAVVFVAADVETDGHILMEFQGVELRAFVFDDLKLDILGVFVVGGGDHEFAFDEATRKVLGFSDPFELAGQFVHAPRLSERHSLSIEEQGIVVFSFRSTSDPWTGPFRNPS